jgi:hypothetical protein
MPYTWVIKKLKIKKLKKNVSISKYIYRIFKNFN